MTSPKHLKLEIEEMFHPYQPQELRHLLLRCVPLVTPLMAGLHLLGVGGWMVGKIPTSFPPSPPPPKLKIIYNTLHRLPFRFFWSLVQEVHW